MRAMIGPPKHTDRIPSSRAVPGVGGRMGVGVGWTVQVAPSHRSTSGRFPADPTAMHAMLDSQETSPSEPSVAPASVGVVCTDHCVPSQRSANVKDLYSSLW